MREKESPSATAEDAQALKDQIRANVDQLILPVLVKLRGMVDSEAKTYLDLLEKHLQELLSPVGYPLFLALEGLTQKELKICGMIRNGLSNKQIAIFLGISPLTVHTHRNRIRKKLGLANRRKNLYTYLTEQPAGEASV